MKTNLTVEGGYILVPVQDWDNLQAWQRDLLRTSQAYQRALLGLSWLLVQRLSSDEAWLIQFLNDENNHLLVRIAEQDREIERLERELREKGI